MHVYPGQKSPYDSLCASKYAPHAWHPSSKLTFEGMPYTCEFITWPTDLTYIVSEQ